jgi:inner membrane protein
MDPIAHSLAGTLLARAYPSHKRGLTAACLIGAIDPDLDVLLTLFGRDFYITEHRGFTHSLLGMGPSALLAALIAWWIYRKSVERASFGVLWAMALAGVTSHMFLDWCTTWGTMLLWPNKTRFALDHLFIVDPWYWLLLSIPVGLSFLFFHRRVSICSLGIGAALLYHGMTAFNHHQALQVAAEDRPQAWRAAFPQPFSPFRWSVFDRGDGLVRNARVDFLKKLQPLSWEEFKEPLKSGNIQAAMDSDRGKIFLWFARVPMWEEKAQPDGSVEVFFWDMRFNNYLLRDRISRGFGAYFKVKKGMVFESRF